MDRGTKGEGVFVPLTSGRLCWSVYSAYSVVVSLTAFPIQRPILRRSKGLGEDCSSLSLSGGFVYFACFAVAALRLWVPSCGVVRGSLGSCWTIAGASFLISPCQSLQRSGFFRVCASDCWRSVASSRLQMPNKIRNPPLNCRPSQI